MPLYMKLKQHESKDVFFEKKCCRLNYDINAKMSYIIKHLSFSELEMLKICIFKLLKHFISSF